MYVFLGDSVTEWPGGYVDLLAGQLGASSVVNAGVAGDRLEHLQRRLDVAAASVLAISAGVNDTLVAFFEGPATPPDVFEERYADLLRRSSGVPRVLVVEPFFLALPSADAPWRDGLAFARADLDAKRPVVRRLAARFGAVFVPLQDRFDAAARSLGAAAVAPDGVHPAPLGHRLIADAWLSAFGATARAGATARDGATVRDGSDGATARDGSDGATVRDGSDGATARAGRAGATARDGSDGATVRDGSDGATARDGSLSAGLPVPAEADGPYPAAWRPGGGTTPASA